MQALAVAAASLATAAGAQADPGRRATARVYLQLDAKTRAVAKGRMRRQRTATLAVTRALRPGRHRVVITVRYAHTIVRHFRMITVR
jgi:hypothetical protein